MRPRNFLMRAFVAATAAACAEKTLRRQKSTWCTGMGTNKMDAVMAVLRNPYADPMLRQYAMDILYKTSGKR